MQGSGDRPWRIGVVTVTYNSAPVLPDFLETLQRQRDVEVVLVALDNASSDASAEVVEAARSRGLDVRLVRNETNEGLAAANNTGMRLCLDAEVDWIALMNNDTSSSDALLFKRLCDEAAGLGALAASPAITMSDPPGAVWYDGARINRWRGHQVKHADMGRPLDPGPRPAFTTDHIPHCCILLRPEVVDRVGPIDEAFFVYGEDVDYSLRLQDAGIERWVLSACRGSLVHEHSSVTGGFLSDFTCRWLTRNWVLVHRKRARGLRLLVGLGYVQAWILGRLLLRRERLHHFGIRQRGFRDGLSAPAHGGS